jgi:hypothetical protein
MAELIPPGKFKPAMEVPHSFAEAAPTPARPMASVLVQPNPFEAKHVELGIPTGWNIREIVRHSGFPAVYDDHVRVWVNDEEIPREMWSRVRPKAGVNLYVRVTPQGGGGGGGGGQPGGKKKKGGILGTILMVVVTVVVAFVAPYLAGALGFVAGTASFAVAKAVIGFGLTMLGGLLVSSLVKPPKSQPTQQNDQGQPISQRALLTGVQNRFEPYAFIPRVIGRRRLYPLLAARPYTEAVGPNRFVRALLCVGWGPLAISDIKIGDTPITAFSNIEYEVREGWASGHTAFGTLPGGKSPDAAQTLFTNSVTEETFTAVLAPGVGVARLTRTETSEVSIDVTFPGGLAFYNDQAERQELTVQITCQYRVPGGSYQFVTWDSNSTADGTQSNGSLTCIDKSGAASIFGGTFKTPGPGQYEILLTRATGAYPSDRYVDRAEFTALRSIRYQNPVNTPGVSLIAVRMRATDQFQGLPDQINCVAQSYLPTWSGSSWAWALSQSPAWAYADMMRRRGTTRVIPDSRIDLPTIQAWATGCAVTAPNADEPRWTVNSIYEGGSIFTGLREIAGHGRGAFTIKDGKYSVVRDIPQTVPVQHISPRNSYGYSGSKPFIDYPDALKVNFINAARGFQEDEVIVYFDGYDATNATKFEALDLPGCTSATQAWREARYYMAVARLRPEEHSVSMDIEALRCTAGDLVQFSHDVISIGLGAGRIKELVTSGSNTVGLVLDTAVPMAAGLAYAIRIRTDDGTSLLYTLATVGTTAEYSTVTLITPVVTSSGPQAGDLFLFGEATRESAPMVVKRIEPGQDFTIRLTLMDAQPGVHTADTGPIPAFDSYITEQTPITQQRPPEPTYVLVSDETALGRLADGSLDVRILVNISQPPPSAVPTDFYEVQYRETGSVAYQQAARVPVRERSVFISGIADAGLYDVRVRAINQFGPASDWVERLNYRAVGKTTPPPNVEGFAINIVGAQAHLTWLPVTVLDLAHYRVRHSAEVVGANYANAIDLVPYVAANATSVVVPAITGTYFMKAYDVVGLSSATPSISIALIDGVNGLNAVASSVQHPSFTGAKTDVAFNGTGLVLGTALFDSIAGLFDSKSGLFDGGIDSVFSVGTYEFAAPVDLGAVYTSRCTSMVKVTRVDYSSLWDYTFGLFDDRAGDFDGDPQAFDDVNVELYVATTNDNPSGSPTWSAWRRFVVGDYTARGFKFRAVLVSSDAGATPEVTELSVTIDMPDRTARGNNVASGTGGGGLTVTFSPAFYAAPAIAIAAQNLATGDYFTITGKSATGFTITFRNSAGTVIDRTFDWQAAGYGEAA